MARLEDILVESGAVLPGRFRLKSGRESDTFIDFGHIPDGRHLADLGECYADKILETVGRHGFDVVFGPAYKGIPIATAVVVALQSKYTLNKRYAFNRKVPKDHGEGGQLIGSSIAPEDKVLIVDDVFSDGKAKLDAIRVLKDGPDPDIVHIIVGVDRSEPGKLEEFDRASGGIPVTAITNMQSVRSAAAAAERARTRRRA